MPTWNALSRVQRRFVWNSCVYPLLAQWPTKVAELCTSLVVIAVAFRFGGFDHFAGALITIVAAGFIVPLLFGWLVVIRHRHDIEKFIQSHGPEIQSLL